MGILNKLFSKNKEDEEVEYNPYYRKIPVLGYITLISNEEIEFRKRYVELLMERNKLKREENK